MWVDMHPDSKLADTLEYLVPAFNRDPTGSASADQEPTFRALPAEAC
jgi:hypothetical protein